MSYVTRIRTSGSLERLEELIAERLKPGADKKAVDRRIWDLFGEQWAVMFTDLAGFSRSAADFGVVHFLQTIMESERIFVPCIERHDGFLLKIEGDSMLIIFRNIRKAIECGVDMQKTAKAYNEGKSEEEHILPCLGLGYGPMIRVGDQDVFGTQVNAASKLGEDTAQAWEILTTGEVKDAAVGLDGVSFEPIDTVPPGAKAAFRLDY